MAINFQYRCGILEAADTTSDTEWCWFNGDTEITKSRGGEPAGTVSAPPGAQVTEVKAIIRRDADGRQSTSSRA